jgi:hypothetical protein
MATKTWSLTATGDLSVSGNWVPSGVPATTNDVYFPPGSPAVTAGLTALNNATLGGPLGRVVFQPGFNGAVATSTTYMQFTCTSLDFSGTGLAYLDLQASSISPQIHNSSNPAVGYAGIYILGSALSNVNVNGGTVGLAWQSGETATATTVSVCGSGATALIGPGVTLTNVKQTLGYCELHCAASGTVSVYGGTFYSKETGTIATLHTYGGTIYCESTGTITTLTSDGGTTNFLTSQQARTVSTMKINQGSMAWDPAVLTVTTQAAADYAIRVSVSKATS